MENDSQWEDITFTWDWFAWSIDFYHFWWYVAIGPFGTVYLYILIGGDAQINYLKNSFLALLINHNILQFDVMVDDS